jgi:ABC-type long-subunit fatty acid transport system fused permease/ATPase subunit
MKEIFNLISTYGFPMVLSIYLLVRFEPMLKELKESVDTLIIINEMNNNDKNFKH